MPPVMGEWDGAVIAALLAGGTTGMEERLRAALPLIGRACGASAAFYSPPEGRPGRRVIGWSSGGESMPLFAEESIVRDILAARGAYREPLLLGPESDRPVSSRLETAGFGAAWLLPLGWPGHDHGTLVFLRRRATEPWREEHFRLARLIAAALGVALQRWEAEHRAAGLARVVGNLERARTIPPEVRRREADRRMTYHEAHFQLECRLDLIPPLADHLVAIASDHLSEADVTSVKIGLVEILNNAIEHGSLAITSSEKEEATMSERGYDALIAERMQVPSLAGRRVFIQYRATAEALEWVVRDEGAGFNWRKYMVGEPFLPSPLHPSGRGLYLCRHSFDCIEYNDSGNEVCARILLGGIPEDFEPHPSSPAADEAPDEPPER